MSARCPLCGSKCSDPIFEGADFLYGASVQAEIVQCKQCGLAYLWPRPDQLSESYPDEYAPYVAQHASSDIAYSIGYKRGLVRKAKLAGAHQTGPLLDIGCGAGQWLAVFRSYSNDQPLWGMDISREPVRKATRPPRIDGWVGTAATLPLPSETLSVVTMWHVLEHLRHPVVTLAEIRRVLRKDGTLILACPLLDSWEAELFGPYWAGYDSPRHLFFYSRETLRRLLGEAGFEVSEIPSVVYGFNSARLSSAFWLGRHKFFRHNLGFLRGVAAIIGVSVAAMTEVISRIFSNQRSVGVFVAHRR